MASAPSRAPCAAGSVRPSSTVFTISTAARHGSAHARTMPSAPPTPGRASAARASPPRRTAARGAPTRLTRIPVNTQSCRENRQERDDHQREVHLLCGPLRKLVRDDQHEPGRGTRLRWRRHAVPDEHQRARASPRGGEDPAEQHPDVRPGQLRQHRRGRQIRPTPGRPPRPVAGRATAQNAEPDHGGDRGRRHQCDGVELQARAEPRGTSPRVRRAGSSAGRMDRDPARCITKCLLAPVRPAYEVRWLPARFARGVAPFTGADATERGRDPARRPPRSAARRGRRAAVRGPVSRTSQAVTRCVRDSGPEPVSGVYAPNCPIHRVAAAISRARDGSRNPAVMVGRPGRCFRHVSAVPLIE